MLAHPPDREHAHARRKGPSDYERDLTARENRVRGRCACGRALLYVDACSACAPILVVSR
jgi:hypothetical protein